MFVFYFSKPSTPCKEVWLLHVPAFKVSIPDQPIDALLKDMGLEALFLNKSGGYASDTYIAPSYTAVVKTLVLKTEKVYEEIRNVVRLMHCPSPRIAPCYCMIELENKLHLVYLYAGTSLSTSPEFSSVGATRDGMESLKNFVRDATLDLRAKKLRYTDWHPRNVLYDDGADEFYLIDFGDVQPLSDNDEDAVVQASLDALAKKIPALGSVL